jgi:Spy/CpxP family protein refolding chaperone
MQRGLGLVLFLIGSLAHFGTAFAQQSPYAGEQRRAIKSLSPTEVDALTNGTGMGLAKVGELNGYPGPAHILGMGDMLKLSSSQKAAITAIVGRMSVSAKALGGQILDRESVLNGQFAKGTITPDLLNQETAEIGRLQGQLRAVHLEAHLETKALLNAEQIAAYNKMRGYAP